MASIAFGNGVIIPSSWLNDVDGLVYNKTVLTATAGQTVFTVTEYQPNGHSRVEINGLGQILGTAYTESSSTTITFTEGLAAGDVVVMRG